MMTLELLAQILTILLLIIVTALFSREGIDTTTWILLLAIIASIFTAKAYNLTEIDYFNALPYTTILFLFTMDLYIRMLTQEHIFEYAAVRLIHLTQSNPRTFFYLVCVSSALLSGVMEDVSCAIIVQPLIFRATSILKMDSRPYLYGISYSITIGNLLTPFASPVNILISDFFLEINIGWFFMHFFILFCILLIPTLIFIDFRYIRAQPPPSEQLRRILIDIMNPTLLISNKNRFRRFVVYFVLMILALLILPQVYRIIILLTAIVYLIEYRKRPIMQFLKQINWKLPLTIIALFLFIINLDKTGTIPFLTTSIKSLIGHNLVLALLIVMILTSLIGSFISKSLGSIIFMTIIQELTLADPLLLTMKNLLIVALFLGIQIGGNLTPQASSQNIFLLDFAREKRLDHMTYKEFSRINIKVISIFFAVGFVYLMILTGIYTLIFR